jgi:DNA mismatch repair protein MutS
VGASDDLASGRSTFMVEMTETAHILRHATSKSLVLLDEVGRGTSTFDGLSIAWATAEHLAQRLQAMTLFSTHYLELTELASDTPTMSNVHFEAKNGPEGLRFLHKVQPGPANKSFGIEVAQLAGLPKAVLKRANERLQILEAQTTSTATEKKTMDETDHHTLNIISKLEALDIDALSPREAASTLYELKSMLETMVEA